MNDRLGLLQAFVKQRKPSVTARRRTKGGVGKGSKARNAAETIDEKRKKVGGHTDSAEERRTSPRGKQNSNGSSAPNLKLCLIRTSMGVKVLISDRV